MSWNGQNVACHFNVFSFPWFSCHLEHLRENLWQPNTILFSYFSLSTGDTFSQLFFFLCEWERYFFWISITQQQGKNHKTNPRHQNASLDSMVSLLLNATENCLIKLCTAMHGFNFTHRGICLQMTTTFSHTFLSKTANSIQSLIFFVKLTILTSETQTRNCCRSESDHIKLLILFLRPIHAA